MTEPREALTALLHKETWLSHGLPPEDNCGYCATLADRLLAAGVHLGDEGLRAAGQAVVDLADPDDDFEGQYIDYLVPFEAIHALRAVLAAQENPA